MNEIYGGDQPDKPETWDIDDTQEFFRYCNRVDFLDWLKLKRDEALELNSDLEKPDGSGKLSRKFIIHSAGTETGFSFSYQRLKLVPMNRHPDVPFEKVFIRLPIDTAKDLGTDGAFLTVFTKDNTQNNYYVDKDTFSKVKQLDDGNYEIVEEASETDYEDLRIILANFEIDLQNNSPGNAA